VAETPHGSFGILPRRLDCVAVLAAGILTFESENEGEKQVRTVLAKLESGFMSRLAEFHRE
jgi:F-type H+-transporting ATPase subunit epsilon